MASDTYRIPRRKLGSGSKPHRGYRQFESTGQLFRQIDARLTRAIGPMDLVRGISLSVAKRYAATPIFGP